MRYFKNEIQKIHVLPVVILLFPIVHSLFFLSTTVWEQESPGSLEVALWESHLFPPREDRLYAAPSYLNKLFMKGISSLSSEPRNTEGYELSGAHLETHPIPFRLFEMKIHCRWLWSTRYLHLLFLGKTPHEQPDVAGAFENYKNRLERLCFFLFFSATHHSSLSLCQS